MCNQEAGQKCNQHPSTQWGVCTKTPVPQRVNSPATPLRRQCFLGPLAACRLPPAACRLCACACACRLRLALILASSDLTLALTSPSPDRNPDQADWDVDHDDDESLPVDFHFYTTDALLHNAKLHINEDSPMAAARIPKDATIRDEL